MRVARRLLSRASIIAPSLTADPGGYCEGFAPMAPGRWGAHKGGGQEHACAGSGGGRWIAPACEVSELFTALLFCAIPEVARGPTESPFVARYTPVTSTCKHGTSMGSVLTIFTHIREPVLTQPASAASASYQRCETWKSPTISALVPCRSCPESFRRRFTISFNSSTYEASAIDSVAASTTCDRHSPGGRSSFCTLSHTKRHETPHSNR